jgi:hypothetical protein
MNARLLLLTGLAMAGLAASRAEEPAAAPGDTPIPTSTSDAYPQVTCTTNDAAACADALQLATDTREALSPLLKLGTTWRFPVHIHVLTRDDPLTATIDREATQVLLQGDTMTIDAFVPLDDSEAREFIQRQYVVALLWERFFAQAKTFDKNTQLDIVPLWLAEGLREWINEDPTHNREAIARRALHNQTAPTLDEITGWKTLSDDRLLGLWQRAFSFYLVDSLVREGARRDDFQQWLDSFSSPGGSGQLHFPTEANWEQELAAAADRSRSRVYTWQETADELAADDTITFAESKTAPVKTCTIDEVADKQRTTALLQAVQEKFDVLTALELRAHPAWHSILEAYRSALSTLLQDEDSTEAGKLIAEAHGLREGEMAHHQKLVDYINWFEVTRDFGNTTSPFRTYFATAKKMEQAQADPAHPNPIRANLLQIESKL